jgi:hypothetical protein
VSVEIIAPSITMAGAAPPAEPPVVATAAAPEPAPQLPPIAEIRAVVREDGTELFVRLARTSATPERDVCWRKTVIAPGGEVLLSLAVAIETGAYAGWPACPPCGI